MTDPVLCDIVINMSNSKYSAQNSLHRHRHYATHYEQVRERNSNYRKSYTAKYNLLLRRAKKQGLECDLTLEDYITLVSPNRCHYTGDPLPEKGYGLDRKDSARGYLKDNVVPCCAWVNSIKREILTYEETVEVVKILSKARQRATQDVISCDRTQKTISDLSELVNIPLKDGKLFVHGLEVQLVPMDITIPPQGLCFRTSELLEKPDIVKSMVLHKAGVSTRIYARDCEIVKVEDAEARVFYNRCHLKGYSGSSIYIGLKHSDKIMALMGIKNSGGGEYELNRYANQLGISVVGGFSKCLSHFEREFNPIQLLSYVDLRYHDGDSYEGWEHVNTSIGFWWTNGITMYNRLKFRSNMDERNLKQDQYAAEKGFWKIYDNGQAKFIKSYASAFDDRPKEPVKTREELLEVYYESERLKGFESLKLRLAEFDFKLLSSYEEYCYRSDDGKRWVTISCSKGHVKKTTSCAKFTHCKSCQFKKGKGRDYSPEGLKHKLAAMGYTYVSGVWDNGKDSVVTYSDERGDIHSKKWRYITP